MIRATVLLLLVMLAACAPAPRGGGDVLVMGDSILFWNSFSDRSVPDVLGRALGRDVANISVPGAQFDNASAFASAGGFDIRAQYPGGRWNWIVLNGGGNDLGSDCNCGACDGPVDALIGPDASSGTIPPFLRKLRATGAQVLWVGYYAGNGKGSFEGCRDDLVRMEQRIARFAARTEGVYFADAEDVFDSTDPDNFARDNTHPSPKGSAVVGTYLAGFISRHSGSSQ